MQHLDAQLTRGMPQYTRASGMMQLDKGTASKLAHTHVSITRPDGSEGRMTLPGSTAHRMKAKHV
jgi:hypothetical protein